jgi:hypothetical protein
MDYESFHDLISQLKRPCNKIFDLLAHSQRSKEKTMCMSQRCFDMHSKAIEAAENSKL